MNNNFIIRNPSVKIFYVLLLRNPEDIPNDPNQAKLFLKLGICSMPNVDEKFNS